MKRTRIKPISKKRAAQIKTETDIKRLIFEFGDCMCEWCHTRVIADRDHEIVFRSQGGDPTDAFNIIQLCRHCHNKEQGLLVPHLWPTPKDELLAYVRAIRIKQGFAPTSP